MHYNALLCRYNEIATKTGNRRMFEDMLVNSLRRRLVSSLGDVHFVFERGRIFIIPSTTDFFPDNLMDILRQEIPGIAGLASISPALQIPSSMEELEWPDYLEEETGIFYC